MDEPAAIRISGATHDQLQALRAGGVSVEDVIVAGLEAYEAQRFWAEAESAAAVESSEERGTRRPAPGAARQRRRGLDELVALTDPAGYAPHTARRASGMPKRSGSRIGTEVAGRVGCRSVRVP